MLIEIIRKEFTEQSTIGECYIDGKFFCYTLEDKDRGLTQSMTADEIKDKKIYAQTAIPKGNYNISVQSTSLKGVCEINGKLPMIENVKGFAGVFLHVGNTAENSKGCILFGKTKSKDFIGSSRETFTKLFNLILKENKVTLIIK